MCIFLKGLRLEVSTGVSGEGTVKRVRVTRDDEGYCFTLLHYFRIER